MNKKRIISGFMSMVLAISAFGGVTANATLDDPVLGVDYPPVGDDYHIPVLTDKVTVQGNYVYVHYFKGTSRVFDRGDINRDGNINVADLNILAAHVKGIKPILEDEAYYIADINADGERNVTDTALLAAYIKGKKTLGNPKYPLLLDWYNWVLT